MDPSHLRKPLEEDEVESVHSGAAVEALPAALDGGIIGTGLAATSVSHHPPDPPGTLGALAIDSNSTSNQLIDEWQVCSQEDQTVRRTLQTEEQKDIRAQEQDSSLVEQTQHPETVRHQQQIDSQSEHENLTVQHENITCQRQLHKDQNNEITRGNFLRVARNIIGDRMLREAVLKVGKQVSAREVGAWEAGLAAVPQIRSRVPAAALTVATGTNTRTPSNKPSDGREELVESWHTLSPARQKQKASGAYLDQSIEQLNDVTAVSGINLREVEKQLLSVPKDESRASKATRRVVQEKKERLVLQRGPLHKKLVEIMSKCGLKNVGADVECCLSLCVEERLCGLIGYLIRVSRQRADIEKARHQIVFTSDVHHQILMMNKRAKEEWEKKQVEEAEKFRKRNEKSQESSCSHI